MLLPWYMFKKLLPWFHIFILKMLHSGLFLCKTHVWAPLCSKVHPACSCHSRCFSSSVCYGHNCCVTGDRQRVFLLNYWWDAGTNRGKDTIYKVKSLIPCRADLYLHVSAISVLLPKKSVCHMISKQVGQVAAAGDDPLLCLQGNCMSESEFAC